MFACCFWEEQTRTSVKQVTISWRDKGILPLVSVLHFLYVLHKLSNTSSVCLCVSEWSISLRTPLCTPVSTKETGWLGNNLYRCSEDCFVWKELRLSTCDSDHNKDPHFVQQLRRCHRLHSSLVSGKSKIFLEDADLRWSLWSSDQQDLDAIHHGPRWGYHLWFGRVPSV